MGWVGTDLPPPGEGVAAACTYRSPPWHLPPKLLTQPSHLHPAPLSHPFQQIKRTR
jgi:hypothetical protein